MDDFRSALLIPDEDWLSFVKAFAGGEATSARSWRFRSSICIKMRQLAIVFFSSTDLIQMTNLLNLLLDGQKYDFFMAGKFTINRYSAAECCCPPFIFISFFKNRKGLTFFVKHISSLLGQIFWRRTGKKDSIIRFPPGSCGTSMTEKKITLHFTEITSISASEKFSQHYFLCLWGQQDVSPHSNNHVLVYCWSPTGNFQKRTVNLIDWQFLECICSTEVRYMPINAHMAGDGWVLWYWRCAGSSVSTISPRDATEVSTLPQDIFRSTE